MIIIDSYSSVFAVCQYKPILPVIVEPSVYMLYRRYTDFLTRGRTTDTQQTSGVNTALYLSLTIVLQWQLSWIPFCLSHVLAWTDTTFNTTPCDFSIQHLIHCPWDELPASSLSIQYNPYLLEDKLSLSYYPNPSLPPQETTQFLL